MCTVTYIPVPGGAVITSNRDEQRGRPPAIAPAWYAGQTGQLLFPKDALAGGTWFVAHENGTVLVLLNGASQKHIPHPPYRKSRGLIALELADSGNSLESFKNLNLTNIEPFTLILLKAKALFECRWDGNNRTHTRLDAGLPNIWSSATLYDPPTIQKRRAWWERWLPDNPAPLQKDILAFHRFAGDGDPANDLLMNREDKLLTVSITSLQTGSDTNGGSPQSRSSQSRVPRSDSPQSRVPRSGSPQSRIPARMYYHDLLSGRVADEIFHVTPSIPSLL